jgi:hypothetical protein
MLETYTCNPSYSGGRDQEDCSSKPAWASSLQDSISKKTLHKKRLVEWLKVQALSSSPSNHKKKKKKKRKKRASSLMKLIKICSKPK